MVQKLQEIIESATSKADICRALGYQPKGGNYAIIDRLLKKHGLVWDKPYTPWNKGKYYKCKQYPNIYDILVKDSPHKNSNSLRQRLIREGLKENKCEKCNISGEEVSLELHHINGDPTDNRLENLQILCPNCHSKTHNFRVKNSIIGRRIQDPKTLYLTDEEIEQRRIQKLAKKCNKTVEQYLEDKANKKTISSIIKICPVCGKEFTSKKSDQKYCSQICYQEDTKGNRPTLIQLIKDFKELKSFVQVGIKYTVTDNAVRKWCRLYGLPIHIKELELYINQFN